MSVPAGRPARPPVAVRFDRVTLTYPGAPAPALRDVDLEVGEGELCLVAGPTGSGKSTLLGAVSGLVPHLTGGELAGEVVVVGVSTRGTPPRDLAHLVGHVGQDPVAGFVTDSVEDELAYAMEQLAVPAPAMRRRVEEVLDLLGVADLRDRPLRTLSGGQAQRVAIGSVLAAGPRVLVLDEPTSALDPGAAEEVLAALVRLVHDLAVTVVVAEHRLERVVQHADRVVLVGRDGRVRDGAPAAMMREHDGAPPVVELARAAGWDPPPLSVRDARRLAGPLAQALAGHEPPLPATPGRTGGPPLLRSRDVVVVHGTGAGRVRAVAGVDLDLHAGEVVALMGRNGSGKSSLLWAWQGSGPRARGEVGVLGDGAAMDSSVGRRRWWQRRPAAAAGGPGAAARGPTGDGRQDPGALPPAGARALVGLVPQTPGDLLYLPTVGQECAQADAESGRPRGTCRALLDEVAPGVPDERHPRDLSEGQRLALVLAVQLAATPRVVLLDEPTRGLDEEAKRRVGQVVRELAAQGRAVVLATHDVELVAAAADRVVVVAQGRVVADGPTAEVVASSPAFAPQTAKVLAPQPWLTPQQVRAALAAGPAPGAEPAGDRS
ncbi:ABC transporter ATP-binding protein [uncultured Pseudokineococcus sp.]|uniref:ABC transporter ATP-binding protein n=1 Tax=uncultured Pseudokineococcus sp. TaxID=1642928 RepID=UPI0026101440|nr:ABC transporter ATP-binding protein [uncultured Pseudokineococcus sp.]